MIYWKDAFNWREQERLLNQLPQFKTTIDGVDIHFMHQRSTNPSALPLVLTHGWPGSFIEFTKIVGPLTDPVAHGGRPEDAFHVVAISLPGFGFRASPGSVGRASPHGGDYRDAHGAPWLQSVWYRAAIGVATSVGCSPLMTPAMSWACIRIFKTRGLRLCDPKRRRTGPGARAHAGAAGVL